jgi:LacI family transcriptional regulator
MARLSLKAIGDALGVSAMSVSLALRGRPGISESLRRRIVAYARSHGYRPDPVAAELMSLVRSRRRSRDAEVLAYINTFSDPTRMAAVPTFVHFFEGARRRAATFGYRVEEFRARAPGMSGARLSQILKARGVRGILVGPRWRTEPDIDFDWGSFSVVLVGEAEYGPNIYRVCNHHIHTCATALRELAARGYRRIGVHLFAFDELKRGHDYLLGVDQYRRDPVPQAEIVVDLVDRWEPKTLRRWIERHRLDAVVTLHVDAQPVVSAMSTPDRQPLGYANLDLPEGSGWSGMNQHPQEIGAAAVDLLRSLLHGGERGTAPAPRILLIDGSWTDGSTARHAPLPDDPARAAPRRSRPRKRAAIT